MAGCAGRGNETSFLATVNRQQLAWQTCYCTVNFEALQAQCQLSVAGPLAPPFSPLYCLPACPFTLAVSRKYNVSTYMELRLAWGSPHSPPPTQATFSHRLRTSVVLDLPALVALFFSLQPPAPPPENAFLPTLFWIPSIHHLPQGHAVPIVVTARPPLEKDPTTTSPPATTKQSTPRPAVLLHPVAGTSLAGYRHHICMTLTTERGD
jgi:hypothetical protein